MRTLISAYRLYLKYMDEDTEALSLTRVWLLRRFIDARMLSLTPCRECGGKFITYHGEPTHGYRCVMCHPPSRQKKPKACNVSRALRL
ncbi:hypothetical protein D6N97_22300 [Salmonella enterica]|nr:hypothetical protein [Salmonella enterica]